MTKDPDVILYGGSVFLAGIQAQLERDTTLELLALGAGQPEGMDLIRSLRPRAVVFDLTLEQPDFAVSLLREQPGPLLIGMDPSLDEMLVISTRPAQARAVNDLVQLILENSQTQEMTSANRLRERDGTE
jgi:hypothetical protein